MDSDTHILEMVQNHVPSQESLVSEDRILSHESHISKENSLLLKKYVLLISFLMFWLIGGLLLGISWRNYPEIYHNELCSYGQPNNGTCECFQYIRKINSDKCNYKEKSWKIALIFQIFAGYVGAGFFYIEEYRIGGLILFLFILTITCIFIQCCSCCRCENTKIISVIAKCIIFVLILWVYNIIEFSLNLLPDSNGVPLT